MKQDIIIIPTNPQKPTDIVKTAVVAWWKSLREILPFAVLLMLCMIAYQLYMHQSLMTYESATIHTFDMHHSMFYRWFIEPARTAYTTQPAQVNVQDLVVKIIYFLLASFISISMIYHFHQLMQKNKPFFFNSITVGLKKFFPYLAVMILFILIVALGYLCLVIPGIYLTVALLFAPYLLITQNSRILESFKQSWNLVKGNWWRTLGTVLLGMLMLTVFLFIMLSALFLITLLIAFVYQMISPIIPAGVIMFADYTFIIIASFLYCIITAYSIFLILCLMYDLQIRFGSAKNTIVQK